MAAAAAGSPYKVPTPSTGRLSLLSSDIEEDLQILDLNSPQFDFVSRPFWWLTDAHHEDDRHEAALQWINSYEGVLEGDDPYFAPTVNGCGKSTPGMMLVKCLRSQH